MNARERALWDDAIRAHDGVVVLSLLALGLAPDRAREVAQAAWTRLIEQHADGALAELSFPGLAIRQARFLALNELRRERTGERVLHAVGEDAQAPDAEQILSSREQLQRAIDALAACSPAARKIFRLAYGDPPVAHAEIARTVGLSLQRVRQTLCETRKTMRLAIDGEEP